MSVAPRSVLTPASLAALSTYLAEEIGLCYPPSRWPDLERGYRAAALELGFADPVEGIATLVASPLSEAHLDVLANHLTIGETHFFRHADVFDVLRSIIVPQVWGEAVTAGRALQVWSAGCCSGEELYSVAILLAQLGLPLEREQVRLLGTDLCPNSLARARAAVYTEWSFRGAPPDVKADFFEPAPGNMVRLLPDRVAPTEFIQHNLASEAGPTRNGGWMGAHGIDVLLCRNVLLYFNDDMARRVMQRLVSHLRVGGWLVVGPCEAHLAYDLGLTGVSGCTVVFQKPDVLHPPQVPLLVPEAVEEQPTTYDGPLPTDSFDVYRQASECLDKGDVEAAQSLLQPVLHEPRGVAVMARMRADQGDLLGAEKLCREALQTIVDQPELHYLLATIMQEQGQEEAAILAHRRALKVKPDHLMAHVSVALLLQRRGQHGEAVEHFREATALLRNGSSLAGMDPVRLAELLQLAESAGSRL